MSKKDDDKLTRGELLQRMTKSDEWREVRHIFFEHVQDLQSIMNINAEDSSDDIRARKIALEYMMDFWKEVTGSVEQHSMDMFNRMQKTYNDEHLGDNDYDNGAEIIQRD